ncbi:MAG TPA: winged helix-turn-helix domain-containing protein, partial [Pseudonocardiaceae bacterium]
MEFAVLGSLHVSTGGRTLDLGWPKQRAVLAALLLSANRPVAVSELVDAVWGERAPASAAAGVQKYVSGLRSLLGAGRLLTRRPGYCLVAGEDELDLLRFDALAAAGRTAM